MRAKGSVTYKAVNWNDGFWGQNNQVMMILIAFQASMGNGYVIGVRRMQGYGSALAIG
jgi:hypothetical protein